VSDFGAVWWLNLSGLWAGMVSTFCSGPRK
jgi:hypothetical protein